MNQTFINPQETKAIFPLRENKDLMEKVSSYDLTSYPEYDILLFKGPVWVLKEVLSILHGGSL